ALRYMNRNAPTLINCLYNQHQFWDGRARTLEETVVRDRRGESASDAAKKHNFQSFIEALKDNEKYRARFKQVFGINEPTADAVAKALATYMRTVLSGNSIVDKAQRERRRDPKADRLTAKHFRDAGEGASSSETLEKGYLLFTGKARCTVCHPVGGLFNDHDFHNVGLQGDVFLSEKEEEGRIKLVPWGLKDERLVGAYRTPSLRALPRTSPYIHDGRRVSREDGVQHFNDKVEARFNAFVARPLLERPGVARRLELSKDDVAALVAFLRALDGDPVDEVVKQPAR